MYVACVGKDDGIVFQTLSTMPKWKAAYQGAQKCWYNLNKFWVKENFRFKTKVLPFYLPMRCWNKINCFGTVARNISTKCRDV